MSEITKADKIDYIEGLELLASNLVDESFADESILSTNHNEIDLAIIKAIKADIEKPAVVDQARLDSLARTKAAIQGETLSAATEHYIDMLEACINILPND